MKHTVHATLYVAAHIEVDVGEEGNVVRLLKDPKVGTSDIIFTSGETPPDPEVNKEVAACAYYQIARWLERVLKANVESKHGVGSIEGADMTGNQGGGAVA